MVTVVSGRSYLGPPVSDVSFDEERVGHEGFLVGSGTGRWRSKKGRGVGRKPVDVVRPVGPVLFTPTRGREILHGHTGPVPVGSGTRYCSDTHPPVPPPRVPVETTRNSRTLERLGFRVERPVHALLYTDE